MTYYDEHAKAYAEKTRNLSMEPQMNRFLPLIPEGGSILDAGCGSGRDSKEFLKRGYHVSAFDLSPAMAAEAEKFIGEKVRILSFLDLTDEAQYDGIWANASLLHLPRPPLSEAFSRLRRALKTNGILFCSFKNRPKDFIDSDGRSFTCFTEESLKLFLQAQSGFEIIDITVSDELWVDALLRAV